MTVRTPLPGWRRYRCRHQRCLYMLEEPARAGTPLRDACPVCGSPWIAVSEAVGASGQPTELTGSRTA